MENPLVITLAGATIPKAIEEKYEMWRRGAYIPLFMKMPGMQGIDDYKVVKKTLELPEQLSIYHNGLDFESRKKVVPADRGNQDIARDMMTTFKSIIWFWINVYELMGSFRNNRGLGETKYETIVEEAQIIHIEGYKLLASEQVKFDNWFNVPAYLSQ